VAGTQSRNVTSIHTGKREPSKTGEKLLGAPMPVPGRDQAYGQKKKGGGAGSEEPGERDSLQGLNRREGEKQEQGSSRFDVGGEPPPWGTTNTGSVSGVGCRGRTFRWIATEKGRCSSVMHHHKSELDFVKCPDQLREVMWTVRRGSSIST